MSDIISTVADIASNIISSDVFYWALVGGAIAFVIAKKTGRLEQYKRKYGWLWSGTKDPVQEAIDKGKVVGFDKKTSTLYVEVPEPVAGSTEAKIVGKTKNGKSAPIPEPVEYNQPGCDCKCHDPDYGVVFCYACAKNKKCIVGKD